MPYKLSDFLVSAKQYNPTLAYKNLGMFYKYTLYMAPQFAMLAKLKDKLLKHYKEFAAAKLEFHIGPFFIDTDGNLYHQPSIDIDAKRGTNIEWMKKQPQRIVKLMLLKELPQLSKQTVHIELTSFNGLHIIADRLYYVDIDKLVQIADEVGFLADISIALQQINKERSNFSIKQSANELFRYLRFIKQLVRRLVLLKLQGFKCVDPAGMNYNPFRRFPSRANIPNKKLWVTPLSYVEFEKLSVTELHLKLQNFKIASQAQFVKLIDRFVYPVL